MKKFKPDILVRLITEAYHKKQGVFENQVNAENFVPKNASRLQKALFLFYIIQLDYAVRSKLLYSRANQLWKKDNKYFDPAYIKKLESSKLKIILERNLKPRYVNEAVKRWETNTKKLISEYASDPLGIFNVSQDALIIIKKIYSFRGFGPKTGNFFFRSMVNTFDLKLKNIDKISQPVDIHDIRLTYEWGLISSDIVNNENIRKTKSIWQKACKDTHISWLTFDRALWILGSEGKRSGNKLKDLEINLDQEIPKDIFY